MVAVVGTPVKGSTFGTSLTVSITVPAGADAVYVLGLTTGTQTLTCTFDGNAMDEISENNQAQGGCAAYKYDSPSEGVFDVVLTPSAMWRLHLHAFCVTGSHVTQTRAVQWTQDAASPYATTDEYPSGADELVFSAAHNSQDSGTVIVSDTGTDLGQTNPTGGGEMMRASYLAGDTPTQTTTYSQSTEQSAGTFQQWGFSIETAAGGAIALVVQDATVAIAADTPVLVQANVLAADDATVVVSTESPALTQANVLAVAGADVAITADTVALTQQALLAVADALVGIAADSPALTQKHVLAVADAALGIDAENVTLSNAVQLVVADALVAIAAEAPALTQQHLLAIQDALVALSAEAPALTQANVLAVQGADVAITVDPITLSNAILLAVADAAVAITVDGIALSPADTLAVQDALLAVTADSPGLVQANLLAVNDALVAVTVGGIVLVLPAEATTGKYAPEHAAALAALGEARGFAADHASARASIEEAGV